MIIIYQSPMLFENNEQRIIQIILSPCTNNSKAYNFKIHSSSTLYDSDKWVLHASGVISPLQSNSNETISVVDLENKFSTKLTSNDIYDNRPTASVNFGPSFRGIKLLQYSELESLALIETPNAIVNKTNDYLFHPALLDACTQSTMGLLIDKKK